MSYLKQSTASQVVPIGPFLDEIDGNTEETALVIANTDIKINKAGAAAVDKNSGGAAHDQGGIYLITLDATDTDTLGTLDINVHVAGALYVQKRLTVLPANVYDSIIAGSDNLEVDIVSMLGSTGASLPSTQSSLDVVDGNVDSILEDTGTTIPAQISGLNDISTVDVRTEVDQSVSLGLASLNDISTADVRTEVDQSVALGLAGLNDISSADVRTEVDDGIAAAGLSTFDASSDNVTVGTNLDKTGYEVTISGGIDVTSINGSTAAANNLAASATVIFTGSATSVGTLTSVSTDLTSQPTDHWKGRALVFSGGVLNGVAVAITSSAGSTLTFGDGAPSAPASGQAFVIV